MPPPVTDIDSFMLSQFQGDQPVNVLCFVVGPEPWFKNVKGLLTIFSRHDVLPTDCPPGADITVEPQAHLLSHAFERHCRGTDTVYDVFFCNEQHILDAIVPQINAAARCCDRSSVFIFPGAVPPSRGMVGPAPTQSWWTGERWALADLLSGHGAIVQTIDLPPVGLLVATRVHAFDRTAARLRSEQLHAEIDTEEQYQAYFRHSSVPQLSEAIPHRMRARQEARMVQLVCDPAEPGVVSTIIDPFLEWQRPRPMFVADLSSQAFDTKPLWQTQRSLHGVTIDEFRNVDLIGRDLILAGPGGAPARAVYGKNKAQGAMEGGLATLADERRGDAATRTVRSGDGFLFPEEELAGAVTLDDPVFLNTPDEHLNFGMWLLYTVPGIKHYRAIKHRYPHFMVELSAPWQRNFLLGLGLRDDELRVRDAHTVYRAACVATMRQTYRTLALAASDRDAFDELAERLGKGAHTYPEKIYISRKTWSMHHRSLLNEGDLIDRLECLGYVTFEPETLPIQEQVRLFHNARSIVGLGGAAMFTAAVCRPGTRLIDIESSMSFIDFHANLFASRGTEYGLILGEADVADTQHSHKRWTIDVARTAGLVRQYG